MELSDRGPSPSECWIVPLGSCTPLAWMRMCGTHSRSATRRKQQSTKQTHQTADITEQNVHSLLRCVCLYAQNRRLFYRPSLSPYSGYLCPWSPSLPPRRQTKRTQKRNPLQMMSYAHYARVPRRTLSGHQRAVDLANGCWNAGRWLPNLNSPFHLQSRGPHHLQASFRITHTHSTSSSSSKREGDTTQCHACLVRCMGRFGFFHTTQPRWPLRLGLSKYVGTDERV